MDLKKEYLELFTNKVAKLLVLLAFGGISLSMYFVFDQHITELQNYPDKLEGIICILSNIRPEQTASTFILKFITGGLLFLFVYGLKLIFTLINLPLTRDRNLFRRQLLRRYFYVVYIGIAMGVLNALIPFTTFTVNYIFFPSLITCVITAMGLIYNEVNKRRDIL